MELAYVAHSESCALLLDSEGICRWIVPKRPGPEGESPRLHRELAVAHRCVGAQYVATLDPDLEGFLGREPRSGKAMLFAQVTNGRVALLRFGPITTFETMKPAVDSRVPTQRVRAAEPLQTERTLVADPVALAERGGETKARGRSIESPAIANFLADAAALADTPYSRALAAISAESSASESAEPVRQERVTRESPAPARVAPSPHTLTLALAPSPLAIAPSPPPPPVASPPVTRPSLTDDDPEIEIHTGSFSIASDADLAALLDGDDLEALEQSDIIRPSGFIRRAGSAVAREGAPFEVVSSSEIATVRTPEEGGDTDDTLRFARAR